MRVRPAVEADLDWLLSQLKDFSKFCGTKIPLFDDEGFARQMMINMMQNHVVLVAEKDGIGLMGLIAGLFTPHVFNPKIRVLAETFWWVPPEHRGTRAGLMLLNEFIDYGKRCADWITCALEEKSPVKDRFLTDRGFVPI